MPFSLIDRSVCRPSPAPGAASFMSTYYIQPSGVDLLAVIRESSRGDTIDVAYLRRSADNGRTWSEPRTWVTGKQTSRGMHRVHPRGGYIDPKTGRYLTVWTEGVLPGDDPVEGLKQWTLHYAVSGDGGATEMVRAPIIHEGEAFDEAHPLPGVRRGKSCAMMGDLGQCPLTRSDGTILVPVQVSHIDGSGEYFNPCGGRTYTDSMVLRGQWNPDGSLAWRASPRVAGDPSRTTRGLIEPTLAALADGRILMVMRGGNDTAPELSSHKWRSLSDDGGETWRVPEPWTYEDGTAFFSPGSCSQLLPWKDGRIFWLGNILPENPHGNLPRYPFVIGEVDAATGTLRRETVFVVDDRAEGDSPSLQLSNFYAREDRETGEVVLHMTRLFANDLPQKGGHDWTADAMLYRIGVG